MLYELNIISKDKTVEISGELINKFYTFILMFDRDKSVMRWKGGSLIKEESTCITCVVNDYDLTSVKEVIKKYNATLMSIKEVVDDDEYYKSALEEIE